MAQRKKIIKQGNCLTHILDHVKSTPRASEVHWDDFSKELDKTLNTLQHDVAVKVVDMEQRLRKDKIRIFGVPEWEGEEDTKQVALKLFQKKLHLAITNKDIDYCYRSGSVCPGKIRSIVVRFMNKHARKKVLSRRKTVEREKINVVEELCPELLNVMKAAVRKFGKRNVEVGEGCMQVNTPEGERLKFPTMWLFEKYLQECRESE